MAEHAPSPLDRFELRRRLGAGAMGVVYEALDRQRDALVALKLLPAAEAGALYRFKREFRALADIAHPNLVNLYELFIDGERCFFTMEKIDGATFRDYVRPGQAAADAPDTDEESASSAAADLAGAAVGDPPAAPLAALDLGRLRAALRQLVEGVAALHAAGTVHRDLKPSNVLVTEEGRVVILDFGLAAEPGAPDAGDGLTGTAAYMAPEQADGRFTPASDWYAVGVMLYEALTGRRPFTGPLLHVLVDKRQRDPIAPDRLCPGLPADLVDLCLRLLDRDPGRRPEAPAILAALAGRGATLTDRSMTIGTGPIAQVLEDSQVIGRDALLGELRGALDRVRAGGAVAAYVHGPSGAGKSALGRAFLAEIARDPAVVVLRGRCYPHESVPYKALDGVVDSLSRHLAALPDDAARALLPRDAGALARIFPVMHAVVDPIAARRGAQGPAYDRLDLRRRAFAALRQLLIRLGDRFLVVVFIDDLHWADADSVALLDDLLRPPDPPPLLLLACLRSDGLDRQPFLRDLLARADGDARRALAVPPLGEAELLALVRHLLAVQPALVGQAEAIAREAAGSPFLAEQLVTHALAGAGGLGARVDLPEVLAARLAAQPAGAVALLDALAVAAHPLAPRLAAEVASLRGDERPLLRRLLAAKLARISGADERVEIYHDRIREALVARLPAERVRELHRRIAAAMERRGLDDYEAIFGHYRAAGSRVKAALYADRAATKAAEALAFDQAAIFYRRAIELAPRPDEEALAGTAASRLNSARLERGLADALASAGRCRDAATAYLRAAELVDQARALELRRAAAEQLLISGHIAEGRRVLDEVLAQVGWRLAASPRRALVALVARRLQLRLHGLDFRPREARDVPPDRLLLLDICAAVATGLSMIDSVRAAEFQARGTILALESGDALHVAQALSMEAFFTAAAGGPSAAEAARLAGRSLELAGRTGHAGALAQATLVTGVCAAFIGAWRRAADHLAAAEEMLRERCPGQIWQRATAQRFGLDARAYLGELGELARLLPERLRDAEERGDLYSGAELRARLGLCWLAEDDPQGHRRELEGSMRRWPRDGFHVPHFDALRALAQADLYEGDPAAAERRIAAAWDDLAASQLLRVQVIRVEAHQLRAAAGLAGLARLGPGDAARRARRRAIERDIRALAGEAMPWSDPLAELLRAGLAAVDGERERAAAAAEAALVGLRAADMALHAAAAARQLGVLRGGDEGEAARGRADAWMRAQGVRRPDRLAALLAPGLAGA